MNLSEIKQVLAERDIRLTKALGQNFLCDQNQLRRIVRAAALQSSDTIIEVGPGLGGLTELLLAQAGQVLALEKDRRLVEYLIARLGHNPKLRLIHTDALPYFREQRELPEHWKLVSNLPYSVGSPILVEVALGAHLPARAVVTLQLEVVRRLLAKPGQEDFGALTLLVGLNYTPHDWFKIGPRCFYPAPDVDSACLTLIRRSERLLSLEAEFTYVRLVKLGFSQRRKMLVKLLRTQWPAQALGEALQRIHASEKARAEDLTIEQFASLARLLPAGNDRPDIEVAVHSRGSRSS